MDQFNLQIYLIYRSISTADQSDLQIEGDAPQNQHLFHPMLFYWCPPPPKRPAWSSALVLAPCFFSFGSGSAKTASTESGKRRLRMMRGGASRGLGGAMRLSDATMAVATAARTTACWGDEYVIVAPLHFWSRKCTLLYLRETATAEDKFGKGGSIIVSLFCEVWLSVFCEVWFKRNVVL